MSHGVNLDTENKLHLQMVDVSNKFGLLKAYHDVDFNKIKLDKKINGSKVKEVFVDQNNQYIIKDIVELIHTEVNNSNKVVYDPNKNRKSISSYICGDNKKIQNITKINNKTSLIEGIQKTINFYKK